MIQQVIKYEVIVVHMPFVNYCLHRRRRSFRNTRYYQVADRQCLNDGPVQVDSAKFKTSVIELLPPSNTCIIRALSLCPNHSHTTVAGQAILRTNLLAMCYINSRFWSENRLAFSMTFLRNVSYFMETICSDPGGCAQKQLWPK